jgi:hypothetical protein
VQTGSRYLGGYISSHADWDLRVQEKVAFWTRAVTDLAFAALSHPQTTFTGLQKSLQHECQFIQRAIEDIIGDCFFDIKDAITKVFLPALYGESLQNCDYHCKIAALPVKFAGLAILTRQPPLKTTMRQAHLCALTSCLSSEAKNFSAQLTTSPSGQQSHQNSSPTGMRS